MDVLPLLQGMFQSLFSCQKQEFYLEVFWGHCNMEQLYSDQAQRPEREREDDKKKLVKILYEVVVVADLKGKGIFKINH